MTMPLTQDSNGLIERAFFAPDQPRRYRTIAPALAVLAALTAPHPGTAQTSGPPPDLTPINCLIQPEETVRLATSVAGVVSEVLVERGDKVAAGAVVARLDATVERIGLELAEARAANLTRIRSLEARVAFLELQLERYERLAARDAIAGTVVEDSRLELAVARLELDEAHLASTLAGIEADQSRALLEQKTLRAPVAGIVTERLIAPGEFRDPQQGHLVTIARLDLLRVEAFAPIAHYAGIRLGQPVTIRPEEPFGGAFPAIIFIVDRVFDAATATFGLVMQLENPDLTLPAGLRCEVDFTPPEER